ncbi:MAG: winged helix-turn-helix transcriptional regulator, partial [Thiohalocapsa sp.]
MTDEAHFRVLRLLAERPDASQRQLAAALGISLGKVNYCIQA